MHYQEVTEHYIRKADIFSEGLQQRSDIQRRNSLLKKLMAKNKKPGKTDWPDLVKTLLATRLFHHAVS